MDHHQFDTEDTDILLETDIWLDDNETWLMSGPLLDEDELLVKLSNNVPITVDVRKQIPTSKPTESKRAARFKTQVIKYEDPSLGADGDDIDLEPPPSFSSLDDFVPDKSPSNVSVPRPQTLGLPPSLNATGVVSNPFQLPESMTATYNVNTSGPLHVNTASPAYKCSALERIKAIKQKYATPPIESPPMSPLADLVDILPNKLSLLNQKLEEVASSTGKFVLDVDAISGNKLSLMNQKLDEVLNNNLFVPTSPLAEAVSPRGNGSASPDVVLPKPKLKKQGTFEILDDETGEDGEEGRYQTMVLPCVDVKPVNGDADQDESPEEYESPFSVSISSTPKHHHQVNTSTITRNNKLALLQQHQLNESFTIERHEDFSDAKFNTSVTYLDNKSNKSNTSVTYIGEKSVNKSNTFVTRLNSSVTYLGDTNTGGNARTNTSVTYLNGGRPTNGENTVNRSYLTTSSEDLDNLNRSYVKAQSNGVSNVNRSYLNSEDNLNRSYIVSHEEAEAESNEEFNATEAESNEEYRASEVQRNMMNQSFTMMSRVEESEQYNGEYNTFHEQDRMGDLMSEGMNTSFTVQKHYDETITYPDQGLNSSDINDNVLNGNHRVNGNPDPSRGSNAATNLSYRTFTRPKKIAAPSGSYRNGTSGLLQKKTLLKPSTGAPGSNLNSTFTQTQTINSANARYATMTRNKENGAVDTNGTGEPRNGMTNRFSTITRPKSKLTYAGQRPTAPQPGRISTNTSTAQSYATKSFTSALPRCRNSSSTESLKSNESYVISRPNGLARGPIQAKRQIYKSTGALNMGPGGREGSTAYSRVQSTENLSVKSGGSDSEGSNVGGYAAIPKPSGLVRPGFSRIPAPPAASRIPAAAPTKPSLLRPSMMHKYSATRKV